LFWLRSRFTYTFTVVTFTVYVTAVTTFTGLFTLRLVTVYVALLIYTFAVVTVVTRLRTAPRYCDRAHHTLVLLVVCRFTVGLRYVSFTLYGYVWITLHVVFGYTFVTFVHVTFTLVTVTAHTFYFTLRLPHVCVAFSYHTRLVTRSTRLVTPFTLPHVTTFLRYARFYVTLRLRLLRCYVGCGYHVYTTRVAFAVCLRTTVGYVVYGSHAFTLPVTVVRSGWLRSRLHVYVHVRLVYTRYGYGYVAVPTALVYVTHTPLPFVVTVHVCVTLRLRLRLRFTTHV